MEEENIVSLWLGTASEVAALESALEVSFSEDGDFLGSEFSRKLRIAHYDSAVTEAEFVPKHADSLRDLLKGVSYSDQILPHFERMVELPSDTNCFVLLYNFRFSGDPTFKTPSLKLTFVGTCSYKTDHD